jgi:hypothetical protein
MKKILILIWATAAAGQAALVTTTSKITEVTVYPDRARVTRAAEVEFNPGKTPWKYRAFPSAWKTTVSGFRETDCRG